MAEWARDGENVPVFPSKSSIERIAEKYHSVRYGLQIGFWDWEGSIVVVVDDWWNELFEKEHDWR